MKYINIDITNQKDISKFYSKLRFYKRFFNKRIMKLNISKNILKKPKEELLMCETAFNIKDKRKRLEYVYDTLCDYHDKLYINTNICEFDKDGRCACQREHHHLIKVNGCCGKCIYMGSHGCTIKSLACKSFFCRYIKKKKNIPSHRQVKLYKYFLTFQQKNVADVNYWTTREENLKLMRMNSILYMFFWRDTKMKRW